MDSQADYLKMLEHSFQCESESECPPETRAAFVACHIFDFTTYDGGMDDLFGRKALEVCAAINERRTFDYITDPECYRWYLLMCNMPFFVDKLEWGTSIRGAWWGTQLGQPFVLASCGLWSGDEQALRITFPDSQWSAFISALVEFGLGDGSP
jgi:hypothetical protein